MQKIRYEASGRPTVSPDYEDVKECLADFDGTGVTIIAPHSDDDLYSNFSWIEECCRKNKTLNIIFMSRGSHQGVRLAEYSKIAAIIGHPINVYLLHAFDDGTGDLTSKRELVTLLDPIVVKCKTLIIPESSNHQDHHAVNQACMASLRYRDSLQPDLAVYSYNYIYNHEFYTPNVYKKLTPQWMDKKIACLRILDNVDKILCNRVNQEETIRALGRVNGCKINCDYAETFRVVRLCL